MSEHKVSIEILGHFRCGNCYSFDSMNLDEDFPEYVYCKRCGHCASLKIEYMSLPFGLLHKMKEEFSYFN